MLGSFWVHLLTVADLLAVYVLQDVSHDSLLWSIISSSPAAPFRDLLLRYYAATTDHVRRLTGPRANPKFAALSMGADISTAADFNDESAPEDLISVVSGLRKRYGLKYVYVWHALMGYWSGISPYDPAFAHLAPHIAEPQLTPELMALEGPGLAYCSQVRAEHEHERAEHDCLPAACWCRLCVLDKLCVLMCLSASALYTYTANPVTFVAQASLATAAGCCCLAATWCVFVCQLLLCLHMFALCLCCACTDLLMTVATACLPQVVAGVGVSAHPAGLYEEMHSYLSAAGIDGVKVDVQSVTSFIGTDRHLQGGPALASKYHQALEASVANYFPGNHCINCMCHSTENLYRCA